METFDLDTCRETRLVLSGTLSTSCACANPNTLMRLICKKQESGLLSTFSFLYALCQTKYTTHNTHQTNMRKKESGRFPGPFSYTHTALLCAKQNTLFQTNVQKKSQHIQIPPPFSSTNSEISFLPLEKLTFCEIAQLGNQIHTSLDETISFCQTHTQTQNTWESLTTPFSLTSSAL